jgi:hypothetical protein
MTLSISNARGKDKPKHRLPMVGVVGDLDT